ncbi:helix-turn-helix transcriptional regulator [Herminiimonas sp. CN]|uniref:helix-turn-helix domain-containing protein n=1 Tax=Herminiimonas sp. CN TaxID=1349818 RepID=UPI0004731286|nr:helix-turn-helix transcriptional regulator [Herminiimonas sp. CN]
MADYVPQLIPMAQALAAIDPAEWFTAPQRPQTMQEPARMQQNNQRKDAPMLDTAPAPVVVSATEGETAAPQTEQRRQQSVLVKTIGARMAEARDLCNLSQSEAARRFGYANPSKLSKVELATDTNSVPLWLIVRAALLYEVSLDWLFGITDDWETGVPRGVQGWMYDAWQKARERDLASLKHLHAEIAAVSTHLTAMAAGAHEVTQALDTLRARNPAFDDMPASGTLAGRLERLQERARAGELALKRFHLNLRPGAASTT